MCLRTPRGTPLTAAGFTLVEMMIVSSILVIVVVVGLTKYAHAIRAARMQKAKQELKVLAHEIDLYQVQNGFHPATLADVGRPGKLDPWGNPYMYLNFQAGTGSAVEFVLTNGLIDPQAVKSWSGGSGTVSGISSMSGAEPETVPADAAKVADLKRKDAFLFPLNTDYDLFSLGPNGKAFAGINSSFSLDDVIRANNGGYYGPASEY